MIGWLPSSVGKKNVAEYVKEAVPSLKSTTTKYDTTLKKFTQLTSGCMTRKNHVVDLASAT